MSTVIADVKGYDKKGVLCESVSLTLPPYLDWMPIDVKVYWYTARGQGNPEATHALFVSQGEQRLITLEAPLICHDFKELKEIENGLEVRVERFIDEGGYSRTPRNQ